MSDTTGRMRRTGILQMVIILVAAASVNAGGIMDAARSITEQLWEHRYIPDSGLPTVPLTEYEEFDVVELFRAETIEDLDAAIKECYPMPWLEEILKDESIPWEDRYWLDRRVRAAIAQNSHMFFNPQGNSVFMDADEIFPGEYYWREHMIVDPEGRYASEEEKRPVFPTDFGRFTDSGYILNSFGRKVGDIAIAENGMSLSRDASIGVFVSGLSGEFEEFGYQHYACLLYPDGSFREIPFEDTAAYSGSVSADGNVLVFFRQDGRSTDPSFVEVMDRDGRVLRRIPFTSSEGRFENMSRPPISSDGKYASCIVISPIGHSSVFDLMNGSHLFTTQHEGNDTNTQYCMFSPDGNFLAIGGVAQGRVIRLSDGQEYAFPETTPGIGGHDRINVSCSNSGALTAIIYRKSDQATAFVELLLYKEATQVCSISLDPNLWTDIAPEVSPNGHFVLVNPVTSGLGGCVAPSCILVMGVEGRSNR